MVAEPSLYAAIKFVSPRGADIVLRLIELLRNKDVFNMDIPRFRTADHQSRYITNLQQEVINAVTLPGMLTGALHDVQDATEPLIEFNLPGLEVVPVPPRVDCRLALLIRFAEPETFTRRRHGKFIDIPQNGRTLRFDEEVVYILDRLCRSPFPTVGEVIEGCSAYLSPDSVRGYLSDMSSKGILTARPPC